MLIDKIVTLHNKLIDHKNEICNLASEFEHVEESIQNYNSSQFELKNIQNSLNSTRNNLTIIQSNLANLTTIVENELKAVEEINSKIDSINRLDELKIVESTTQVQFLAKESLKVLDELDKIREFVLARARNFKIYVISLITTGAIGGIGFNWETVSNFFSAIFG